MARPLVLVVLLIGQLVSGTAEAQDSNAALYPANTVAYSVTDNLDELNQAFQKTQFGRIGEMPAMKPIIDELDRALRASPILGAIGTAEITIEDLAAVAGGETSIGLIGFESGSTPAAYLAVMDITGHEAAADALLAKVRAAHVAAKHREAQSTHASLKIWSYTWVSMMKSRAVSYCITPSFVMASDDLATLTAAIDRIQQPGGLSVTDEFTTVLARSADPKIDALPNFRMFLRPIALAEAAESIEAGKAGTTSAELSALKQHGFLGLRAIGGHVALGSEAADVTYRTFIWAPPPREDALNILTFLPLEGDALPDWIDSTMGTASVGAWDIEAAFNSIGPIFDTLIGEGEEGLWEEIVLDIEEASDGPGVSLRREFLPLFTKRFVTAGDSYVPAGAQSSQARLLMALEVNDERKLRTVLRRLMIGDPEYSQKQIGNVEVWQYEPMDPKTPKAALCAARGHLLIATHVSLLERVLAEPTQPPLASTEEFKRVRALLNPLASGTVMVMGYSELSDAVRPIYEQFQTDGAETNPLTDLIFAGLKPDFSKAPPFATLAPMLGEGGLVGTIEADGWTIQGLLLPPAP
jgi:hypothetical protein